MKGNVINLNTLHLNSVRLNGIGKVQSVSLKGGSTEDPVFPPVEPPIEPEPTPTYTLSASVTNGMVSAKRNGSAVNLPFTANEGDTIALSVTPNDGYEFNGWNDGNTDNPRTITMNADVALSAQCVEVVQPPVGNYIQFEDKAVEAICVANWSSDGIGLTMEDAAKVTSIGTTFKGNTEITSFNELRFFTGVTSLVASAFEGCSALTSLSVEHIEEINSRSLYGCTALSYDYLNLANLVKLGGNAFYGVKIKKLNLGKVTSLPSAYSSTQNYGDKSVLEEVILANGVTKIPQYSFLSYAKVDMDLPSTITEVERHAFQNCSVLGLGKSLSLPNLITIGLHAFYGTAYERIDNLGNIESITAGISYLAGTFSQNPYLKFVRIPPTCTLVGRNAFAGCPALETVIVEAIIPPTGHSEMFLSTNNTFIIYVPDASLEAYRTATNWNQYADRIHPLSEIEGSLVFYDKLVGDSTAYINTEYYAKGLDSFAWDAEPPTSWNKFLFGCKNTKLNLGTLTYAANQTYYLVGSTTTKLINGNNSARITRQMVVVSEDGAYKRKLIEGGNVVAELGSVGSYASAVSTTPLLVFACQKSASDTSADRIYNGAIRSFSITDIDGNTIMSLKPCTWNGEAGMWDEVGNKFYGNAAASGEFSVAND